MLEFEQLKQVLTEVEGDIARAEGGNKAAGTRVRKKMQEIKALSQDIRKKILESREEDTGETPAAPPSV